GDERGRQQYRDGGGGQVGGRARRRRGRASWPARRGRRRRVTAAMLRLLLALGLLCALPAAGQELTGTLKKIKVSRAVVIGYRESSFPFSYLNAAKRPIGYSIDLCLEIVEEAKDTLGIDDLAVK